MDQIRLKFIESIRSAKLLRVGSGNLQHNQHLPGTEFDGGRLDKFHSNFSDHHVGDQCGWLPSDHTGAFTHAQISCLETFLRYLQLLVLSRSLLSDLSRSCLLQRR